MGVLSKWMIPMSWIWVKELEVLYNLQLEEIPSGMYFWECKNNSWFRGSSVWKILLKADNHRLDTGRKYSPDITYSSSMSSSSQKEPFNRNSLFAGYHKI